MAHRPRSQAPGRQGLLRLLAVATLLGLAINFPQVQKVTHLSPIRAPLLVRRHSNGVIAVPVMVVVMLMHQNKKVMGQFVRISRRLRIVGWLATAVMAVASAGCSSPGKSSACPLPWYSGGGLGWGPSLKCPSRFEIPALQVRQSRFGDLDIRGAVRALDGLDRDDDRHLGHSLVVGSDGAGVPPAFFITPPTTLTIRMKTANATMMN